MVSIVMMPSACMFAVEAQIVEEDCSYFKSEGSIDASSRLADVMVEGPVISLDLVLPHRKRAGVTCQIENATVDTSLFLLSVQIS